MKYHFEKKPLSIILWIVICIVGLCALIPVFLFIEYLFKDYFTYGIFLFLIILCGGGYLIACLMDKKKKTKANNEKIVHNDYFDISNDVIQELEKQSTVLVSLINSAEALPNIADSAFSSYLKGMEVADTPSNRTLLIAFSKKLENIINRKNEISAPEYKYLLLKTYQENIVLFEKL